MPELVSILIPAYNAEKWIKYTIESALEQTWENKEIIIVDDGSTDKTTEIARKYESEFVRVFSQHNSGACKARNKALSYAQGDYIQWLDADDLLAPDKIYKQMECRNAEENDLILYTAAWGKFYSNPQRAKFMADSMWRDLLPIDWFLTKFNDGVWMNPAAWLVSRKIAELAGEWDERISSSGDDDGEYLCRLVANCDMVKFVYESKCYYRVGNTGSLSWNRSRKGLDSYLLSTTLCLDHMLKIENSERTRKGCLYFLKRRSQHFIQGNPEFFAKVCKIAEELGERAVFPPESKKFRIVRNIVGWKTAMKVKNALWIFELQCRKSYERVVDILQRVRGKTS